MAFAFCYVIPAQAGIQYCKGFLDPCLRGSDYLALFFNEAQTQTMGDYKNVAEEAITISGFRISAAWSVLVRNDVRESDFQSVQPWPVRRAPFFFNLPGRTY
jgi:hypothetical protein